MRLIRLFAIAAPLALLLPLSAHAAWPAGVKAQYMGCLLYTSDAADE